MALNLCLKEEVTSEQRGLRVLCLDGGGIRGVITLEFLKVIESILQEKGQSIKTYFDVVSGTSTVGIIISGIFYANMTLEQCEEFYDNSIDKIFETSRIVAMIKKSSTGEMGNSSVLYNLLRDCLPNMMLLDVQHPKIIFTSTDVTTKINKLFLFKNYFKEPENGYVDGYAQSTCHSLVADAVRATSAAPVFLKKHILDVLVNNEVKKLKFQDGGLIANNPTYATIIEIGEMWPNVKIDTIISLGTGTHEEGRRKDGSAILDVFQGVLSYVTNQENIHYQVKSLLKMKNREQKKKNNLQ